MKIHYAVETVFVISTIFVLFSCSIATLPFTVQPDEVAVVFGKAFTYKLPAEMITHPGYTFKFHALESENLPSWLEFDSARNLLLGVPSHHDQGTHTIQLEVINDENNKTADTINFLTVEVVQYEEDLNHFRILRTNTLATPSKNSSHSPLDCPSHTTVIVATLVFDLNSRKLSGSNRVELLNSVSKWTVIDVDQLRWMPGKGEKTAFNLKDVVVLTAGPGWVESAQERGVSVSWKIGCGDSITESERSYASVSHLKSASQTGAFKNDLRSPVVAWHVTYGHVKHRQVVRVRRQALAQTPVPTSAFVTPTASIVTQVIGTPIIARSPTVFTVTPTATRIIPSLTQTASPSPTPVVPSVIIATTPATNNRPKLEIPIGTLTAEIDIPFTFYIPHDTFHDKEDGATPNLKLDMYNVYGNPLPNDLWVKLDPNSQVLRGLPKDLGETVVGLVVTDSKGSKSDIHAVTIKVVPKNVPPLLYNDIDLIRLYVDQPIEFPVPYDTFHDKEDGATRNLTLEMRTVDDKPLSSLSWVAFDAKSQTIYALPTKDIPYIVRRHEFLMIASDSGGKKAIDAFEIHVNPTPVQPNHYFGLELDASHKKVNDNSYKIFKESVTIRVKLCVQIGEYFAERFNTSYKDMRVREYREGSVIFEWSFGNIATNRTAVENYKELYVIPGEDKPVSEFKNHIESSCPIAKKCSVIEAYVRIIGPPSSTTPDPNVVGRVDDDDDGTWWEYTIIPAFVVAALIFIIGLIIIICIRCRRKSKLDKNEKVVFVQRKKPAVFREEYPMREVYGNQPLITPNEKAPLPPPAYPRSSTPTEDPSELLLSDSSPSYQPPFDSGHEPAGNSRPPVASYRLPPPYVAP